MTIDREKFLTALNAVKAGLSPREFIEQSSCFVFQDGMVMTFNDEVSCRIKIPIDIEGAIQAQALLDILGKVEDEELMVRVAEEDSELQFKGKGKVFGVTMDAEIYLPTADVEMPVEEDWQKLPKEFTESVSLVERCASKDSSKFRLTCIHLAPDFIEACDNMQAMRCQVDTGMKKSVLVRATSLAHICELGMDRVAMTESWIHFENESGLIFSCRRYNDEYIKLDSLLEFEGKPLTFPKGLDKAAERAAVFAMDKAGDPLVTITLERDRLKLEGEGISGWYRESKDVTYDGPDMEFMIDPSLMMRIAERYSDAQISDEKLRITGKSGDTKWEYITVLAAADDEHEEREPAPEKEKKGKGKREERDERD
jgi:DNA polymerase III sliding clamp (beta) subunit (PCNA family)